MDSSQDQLFSQNGAASQYQDIKDVLLLIENSPVQSLENFSSPENILAQLRSAFDMGERVIMSEGVHSSGSTFLLLLAIFQQIDNCLSRFGTGIQLERKDSLRAIMLMSTLDHPEKLGYQNRGDVAGQMGPLKQFASQLRDRVQDRLRILV